MFTHLFYCSINGNPYEYLNKKEIFFIFSPVSSWFCWFIHVWMGIIMVWRSGDWVDFQKAKSPYVIAGRLIIIIGRYCHFVSTSIKIIISN